MTLAANAFPNKTENLIEGFNLDTLNSWIEIAKWSPSGGNIQPWYIHSITADGAYFKISIDEKYKLNPNKMDFDGSMAVLAIGGFCESLEQIAHSNGYYMDFTLLERSPKKGSLNHLFWNFSVSIHVKRNAELIFGSDFLTTKKNIENRVTERGPLQKTRINENFIKWLNETLEKQSILGTTIPLPNQKLIKLLKSLEEVRWRTTSLNSDILNELEPSSKNIQVGIPFSSLRLFVLDAFMLWTLKKIHLSRSFLKMGFAKVISHKSVYSPLHKANSFFYLQAKNESSEGYWQLGRALQKIWLKANEEKIGVQPFAGHLIIRTELKNPQILGLTNKDKNLLKEITETFKSEWNINIEKPLFGIRLGYSISEPIKSPRKELSQIMNTDIHKPS
jgi:nitroreductase